MHNYQDLITKLDDSDEEIFWLGSATTEQIKKLEIILDLKLPEDFVDFLSVCGGGGAAGSEICGIENNDATLDNGGTVNYSTVYCRSEFELPSNFAVIYLKDDEVCWVIDCGPTGNGQIISYDLFKKKPSKKIADNFYSFFKEYVELRT
ncbi:SMI1/KNR4 family protein [Pseudomonas fluorescens]|uniref:SMI1/KNR4 family protein n=1 Tax=Pseudomonas TaxID=286 RepID=UPI000BA3F4A0|nr:MULTISPECIES: SMI1/KNR4 family protein [Pseudomonas]MCO7627322.1 SMI1/KNR4 family protein [Pseudomonas fluorescens]